MRVVANIPIAQIVVDREPISEATYKLAKYLERGGDVPPIHVQRTFAGQYKILDGRHRVLAHKLLGLTEISAKFYVVNEPMQQPRPDKPLPVSGEGHIPQGDGCSMELSETPQE